MNFLNGVLMIHAPASALNNGEGEDNKGAVKKIRTGAREYPYVSSQAVRFWLRDTLRRYDSEWQASPIYRGKGKQQSYTEGDPIRYWDDDLFGYMRAEKEGTQTRIAPFRVGTLVSAAPVEIVEDFGVMARMEGDPVLHGHEFYRTALVGTFTLDLSAVGTFTVRDRAGYRNLSTAQVEVAQELGLEALKQGDSYRLPIEERLRRVASLLRALASLEGGAKQTLHHTDVSPAFVCMAVMRGANNPFAHLIRGENPPALHEGALDEALHVYQDDLLSPVLVGLRQGVMDSAFGPLHERDLDVNHPRRAFQKGIRLLWEHPEWMA